MTEVRETRKWLRRLITASVDALTEVDLANYQQSHSHTERCVLLAGHAERAAAEMRNAARKEES